MVNNRPSLTRTCVDTFGTEPIELISADVLVFVKVMEELLSAVGKLGLKLLSYLQRIAKEYLATMGICKVCHT